MKNDLLLKELEGLMTGHWLSDLPNFCSLLFHNLKDINWIGFYFSDGERLRLGPFSGKPACTDIAFDRGVCGAAFSKAAPLVVDDVHSFPGHISCDPDSESELVLPFTLKGKLVGVLDIDSPSRARFTHDDVEFFSRALRILEKSTARLPEALKTI